jgi:hypothetical protein
MARGDGRTLHKYIYNQLSTQLTLSADVLQKFYVKSKTERPTVGMLYFLGSTVQRTAHKNETLMYKVQCSAATKRTLI